MAMAVGAGMTFVVQSSSVFTSAMTPLVGRWSFFSAGVCFSCEWKKKGEGAQLGSLKKVLFGWGALIDADRFSQILAQKMGIVQVRCRIRNWEIQGNSVWDLKYEKPLFWHSHTDKRSERHASSAAYCLYQAASIVLLTVFNMKSQQPDCPSSFTTFSLAFIKMIQYFSTTNSAGCQRGERQLF